MADESHQIRTRQTKRGGVSISLQTRPRQHKDPCPDILNELPNPCFQAVSRRVFGPSCSRTPPSHQMYTAGEPPVGNLLLLPAQSCPTSWAVLQGRTPAASSSGIPKWAGNDHLVSRNGVPRPPGGAVGQPNIALVRTPFCIAGRCILGSTTCHSLWMFINFVGSHVAPSFWCSSGQCRDSCLLITLP